MRSESLWTCFSVCIFTAAELLPQSPSFFALYLEISPFSTPPDIPRLFLHLPVLSHLLLVSLLLAGVVSSSELHVHSLAVQNMRVALTFMG